MQKTKNLGTAFAGLSRGLIQNSENLLHRCYARKRRLTV